MSRKMRLALLALSCLAYLATAEETTLSVNAKKPLAVVSDKFLSVTLDPMVMFSSDALSDTERSTSMAKALSPAYVRIAGPRSNSYVFERGLYPQEARPDPGYTFSEAHWINVHQWAERSGLEVIASVAPQQWDSSGSRAWDPRNALDLISFSDHMGYNTSWQLGYECQTRCDISGTELGRDVQRLRSMLDAFPRYAERGLVAGPDVVTYRTKQQQQYLQDYFAVAGHSLGAVTWHPDFAGITLEPDGVSMQHDDLALDKDSFYRIAGRHIIKKPLWIAESRPEDCKRQFLGALVWARRLGNSAKLGVQVLMRQPEDSNLFRPTPDYWVSVLHKTLVGREVLDTKIAAGNRTHVHFYSHCTRPSAKYERGSLTVFGINLTPSKVTASLKGLKPKVVHKYILLPGFDAPNRMFSESVLLNNEVLGLVDGKRVPELQPVVSSAVKGGAKLKLPSGGIGFWVLPDLKIKSCMGHEDEIADKAILKKLNKRTEEPEIEEENESNDENSHEVADPDDSVEEKKPTSLRSQQLGSKRAPVRRHARHEKGDADEKKTRRIDNARHEYERLEKIAKKNQHAFNLRSGGARGVFESSAEEDASSDESVMKKPKARRPDSGEVLRTKLQEYKKRLATYESKKKHRDLIGGSAKSHFKTAHDEPSAKKKGMETEKVIEALTLITKVEGAVKGLEKQTESENRAGPRSKTPATLSPGNVNDVTAGLKRSSGAPETINDGLLDEVLNTEKAKRTSIPAKIEDQLRALYHLLSEEKDKKEGLVAQRHRRDLDKRAADDSLGARRESISMRKRVKPDDLKERIMERVNERKQRLRERQGRREKVDRREIQESNENNFYGFQTREPLQNFPEGDLYLQTGTDSAEKTNTPISVEPAKAASPKKVDKKKNTPEKQSNASAKVLPVADEHEDVWLEEGEGNPMPREFFENVNMQRFNSPNKSPKEYGELWEAETLPKNQETVQHPNPVVQAPEYANYRVVTEKPLPESEDRVAKERAMQQLMNYYETAVPQEQNYDFADLRHNQQQQVQQQQMAYQQQQQLPPIYHQDPRYTNPSAYYDPRAYMQEAPQPHYHRVKRNSNDLLEAVLHREMITQDDNNLRDCQCRVIRGVEECKDCVMKDQERFPLVPPGYEVTNPLTTNYAKRFRYRRDISADENSDTETVTEAEEDTAASVEEEETETTTTTSSEKEESEGAANSGTSAEGLLEASTPAEATTETLETQLKLESDSEKLAANRLPRKIESTSKFFLKSAINKKSIKESIKAAKRQDITIDIETPGTSTTPEAPTSSSSPDSGNEREADGEHPANIRSVNDSDAQAKGTAAPESTAESPKTHIVEAQPLGIEVAPVAVVTSSYAAVEAVDQKSSTGDSDATGDAVDPTDANGESTDETGDSKKKAVDPPNVASVLNESISNNNKSNVNKLVDALSELKNKTKINNPLKLENVLKTRQTRLTTRAEALAALRKENESKRAKKMIEASMKFLESENARFAEYQKKRHDQLERLKMKLRAKREKMLQQYRDELLQAIHDSADPKERNLHRRDLLDEYKDADDDSHKNTMISDPEKLAYIMRYRPVKYSSRKDSYKSAEDDRYVPVVEVLRPYETRARPSSRSQAKIYKENESSEYESTKDRKPSVPLDKQVRDDDIFDTSVEQESKTTNVKRSPYSLRGREATNDKPMEGDSGEYYAADEEQGQEEFVRLPQPHQIPSYYPGVAYPAEDIIPLHIDYSQQQGDVDLHHVNPVYKQPTNNYYQKSQSADQPEKEEQNSQTMEEQIQNNYYSTKQQATPPQPAKHYYMSTQNVEQEPSEKNYYNENPEAVIIHRQPKQQFYEQNYEKARQASFDRNHQKSKRSNIKIVEIDPFLYEEDENDYNLEELLAGSPSRFALRNYRHVPYGSRRYRREAVISKSEDLNGPLFFSLGLDESKMRENRENDATSADLIRRKRVADGTIQAKVETSFQYASPINKNIKKVYRADYDSKYRKSVKNPRYARLALKTAELPADAEDRETLHYSQHFQPIPTSIHDLDVDNHLHEGDTSGSRSKREKRSSDEIINQKYRYIEDNSINRFGDPEIDEIWNNIIEINEDQQLLNEFDLQKEQIQNNFKENQRYLQDILKPSATQSPSNAATPTTAKSIETTTQVNLGSIFVDAIPKLQGVITGGLKKAQNLTGSLEDFIENFDNDDTSYSNATEIQSSGKDGTFDEDDGRLSSNIFQHMAGSVKKFFGLISNLAKTLSFHGH